MANLITKRLTNSPFSSQIRSIQRTRITQPERIIAWFRYLESNLEEFQPQYDALLPQEKDDFQSLQKVFEAVLERPFRGVAAPTITTIQMGEAFSLLQEYVTCVSRRFSNGLLVVGPGGVGKSVTVVQTLATENQIDGDTYVRITGHSTPLALYNTLYQYREKLIIFDDCDAVLRDRTGIDILKAVLDTIPIRKVCWISTSSKVDIPEFEFKGQVIFVSNLDPTKTTDTSFQALLTRVLTLVMSFTREEILVRMLQILPSVAHDLTEDQRLEIELFLKERYRQFTVMSLRFLVNVVSLRRYSPTNWKKLALNLN